MNLLRRRFQRSASRGQALVELALILPLLALIVMFAVDFGRVFFGYVALNNMARVGANHAAVNPDAWQTPGDPAARAAYSQRILQDAKSINCTLPSPLPNPTFTGTRLPNDLANVTLTCDFSFITPIMGALLGDPLRISAESSFPIRVGAIAGAPIGVIVPLPSNAPTPSPAPTMCTVPQFVGTNVSSAQSTWTTNAGFSTTILKSPNNNGWSTVAAQTLAAGSSHPCAGTTITLSSTAPSPTPTATPSPTPIPQCQVPSFIGDAKNQNNLRDKWGDAGFTKNKLSVESGNWSFVQSQTLVAASMLTCSTATITVGP